MSNVNDLVNKVFHFKKIEDLRFEGKHPNGIDVGYERTGNLHYPLTIGLPMFIGNIRTSFIVGFDIDEKTGIVEVKTENSIYQLTPREEIKK